MKTSMKPRSALAGRVAESVAAQYLTFALGAEELALPITHVREVVEYAGLTRIPLSSRAVPGVLNLRGAVIPVVDLSVRIGRGATELKRRTCIVVVESDTDEGKIAVGMIVDAVHEALDVLPSQVGGRPAFGTGLPHHFVESVLSVQDRFLPVLDLSAVLALRELEQLVTDACHDAEEAAERPLALGAGRPP